jgi:enoyl-CoA hydratase
MYRAWRRLDEDDGLMCAILTAVGDTFCAGMDLKAAAEGHRSTQEFTELMAKVPNVHWQALLRDDRPTKPLILAVEGFALAGGTEMLAGTDLRVAAEDATFGVTEVARGLYPMAGSSIRLPRQIPYCLAAEIVLLGRHVTAQEALSWGLVNRVVPKGQALAEARKIARALEQTGPLALRAITRSLRELQTHVPETEAMRRSDDLAGPVFASQDAREGMRAFKEKRKAVFQGK